jgi:hypothetical protein
MTDCRQVRSSGNLRGEAAEQPDAVDGAGEFERRR